MKDILAVGLAVAAILVGYRIGQAAGSALVG
jgi:hypothetical protein